MPKYELMYILSSAVSDNDIPGISSEVDKFIQAQGGELASTEMLGKKKLAYPIKKTRNGFYVLSTFQMEAGKKLQELDNKLRSIESIIRYMTVNVDEQERRAAKDRKIQEKMRATRKPPKPETPAGATDTSDIKLTETELEQKIEKALGSDDLAA
ncbi:MAG: 30S ribosomal protein S6 [Candidatus Saccharibacteria bacterium]